MEMQFKKDKNRELFFWGSSCKRLYSIQGEKEMNKLNLFLLVFFFVTLFGLYYSFYLSFGHFSNSNDYLFFLGRNKGECFYPEHYADSCSSNKYIGYIILTQISTQIIGQGNSEPIFFLFNLLFLVVLIPITLRHIVKNNWIIPLYFSVSFVFNILYSAVFPQMLIFELFLCLIIFKDSDYKYLFWFLSFFVHEQGFAFITVSLILLELFNRMGKINFPELPFYSVIILKGVTFTGQFLDVFIKFIPFPFAFIGFKELFKQKQFFLLCVLLITVFASILDIRTLLFSELILIIPFSNYVEVSKKPFKILTAILIIEYFVFQLILWYFSSLSLFLGKAFI